MTFGKSRVQFNDFVWKFYRFEKFDVYYNQDGEELAKYTANEIQRLIIQEEEFFNYNLEKRLVVILYNKYSDYKQTNLGLITGIEDYNTGGVSKIINNKLILYFEGDHNKLRNQIRNSLSQVFIDEILYGGQTISSQLIGLSDYKIPNWYYFGLLSYKEYGWKPEIESKIREAYQAGRFRKINKLEETESIWAGHSFWFFIDYTYGKSVISDILFLTHIYKDPAKSFLRIIGKPIDSLLVEWQEFLGLSLQPENSSLLNNDGTLLKRTKKEEKVNHIKINSSGDYIAWIENDFGKYKIKLHEIAKNKTKTIFKNGYKIKKKTDYSYPVIAWSPEGDILSFIIEEKGGLKLFFFDNFDKVLVERNFLYFEKVLSYSYSQNGLYLIMSAIRNGNTDIYTYHIPSATFEQITMDKADDFEPYFSNGLEEIVFRSNRLYDNLICDEISQETDLFLLRLKKKPHLIRILDENFSNELNLEVLSENEFLYKTNFTGSDFIFKAKFDSTISFIDTAIHYRYFSETSPVFLQASVENFSFNPPLNKMAYVLNNKSRQNAFITQLDSIKNRNDFIKSFAQTYKESEIETLDSLNKLKVINLSLDSLISSDTLQLYREIDKDSTIDLNHYIFEVEKLNSIYYKKYGSYLNIKSDERRFKIPNIRLYQTTFYNNYLVSQVDFGFLSTSYQAYTGGAVYYTPGINGLLKIGANDLMEDYKIIGGVRFSADLSSNEFLISFEDLKKQIDKQYIFHRQSFTDVSDDPDDEYLSKVISNQVFYILNYPFTEINSVKLSSSFREDKIVYLSTDLRNLRRDDQYRLWTTVKLEYIFDNTFKPAINLYEGVRYKVFAETFLQVNDLKNDLYVIGADFRFYQPIHKNLIFASRIAASTSFGHSRLLYYLGGVDSWIRLLNSTFDYSVPVNEQEKYAYQTNATNMRGFQQNIRNGNNFFVMNNEIRWPVISYFLRYPTGKSFIDNFQILTFFDIGSAWTGFSPYSGRNAWDSEIIQQGPITIVIDSNRSPFVAGYGFGVRSQLLGYFMRFDWSWGIENGTILPGLFYFSLSLDF